MIALTPRDDWDLTLLIAVVVFIAALIAGAKLGDWIVRRRRPSDLYSSVYDHAAERDFDPKVALVYDGGWRLGDEDELRARRQTRPQTSPGAVIPTHRGDAA